jgi:hypothetical protein
MAHNQQPTLALESSESQLSSHLGSGVFVTLLPCPQFPAPSDLPSPSPCHAACHPPFLLATQRRVAHSPSSLPPRSTATLTYGIQIRFRQPTVASGDESECRCPIPDFQRRPIHPPLLPATPRAALPFSSPCNAAPRPTIQSLPPRSAADHHLWRAGPSPQVMRVSIGEERVRANGVGDGESNGERHEAVRELGR